MTRSNILFSDTTKLVDVLTTNYRLLDVFPCFGMGLGFGDRTVKQVCDEKGIPITIFLLVCNVYTFEDYIPDEQTIEQIQIPDLLDFSLASNKDYREVNRIKLFDRTIELTENCPEVFRNAVAEFRKQYEQILFAYFEYDEQVNFPYIRALARGEEPKNASMPIVMKNKEEVRVAFSDLQNLLIKHQGMFC